MWLVIGRRDDGSAVDAVIAQVDNRPISVDTIRELVDVSEGRNAHIPDVLRSELEQMGMEGLSSGLLAIDAWGEEAAAAAEGELRFENRMLIWRPGAEEPSPATISWHDRSAVVVAVDPDVVELEFEYVPPPGDLEVARDNSRRWLYDQPRPFVPRSYWDRAYWDETDPILDWRLYLGENTLIIEGDSPLRWVKRRLRATLSLATLPVRSGVALLFVKVNHVLGPLGGILARDSGWERRLAKYEHVFRAIADRYPRLAPGVSASDDTVSVLVHGTRSTTLPALDALDSYGKVKFPTYRFEHDTHRPLVENARELATLVGQCFPSSADGPRRVVLIAHSRGGLVARLARALLLQSSNTATNNHWTGTVEVMTLGTPHRGTPLVGEGLNLIASVAGNYYNTRALLKLDTLTDASGVPIEDPINLAFTFLLRRHSIPEGIRAMAPSSDALEELD